MEAQGRDKAGGKPRESGFYSKFFVVEKRDSKVEVDLGPFQAEHICRKGGFQDGNSQKDLAVGLAVGMQGSKYPLVG